MVLSNIGIKDGFSVIYTPNSAPYTAFVQASLKEEHKTSSYEYMAGCGSRSRNNCRN